MQESSYFERAQPLVLLAIGVFMAFSLLDLSPKFYGPVQYMADHKSFAPWFSGAATSLGVWVALANAHWKERRDDVRAANAATKAAGALAENACAIANMSHLCAAVASTDLQDDELFKNRGHLLAGVLETPIETALAALRRFPISQIPRPTALQDWYRLEITPSLLLSKLREIAVLEGERFSEAADERGRDIDEEIAAARRRAVDLARSVMEKCYSVAREMDVTVNWDFGKIAES